MLNRSSKDFNDWKLLMSFLYPNDPIKNWINETNYDNGFKEDWLWLMELVEAIEKLPPKNFSDALSVYDSTESWEDYFFHFTIWQTHASVVLYRGGRQYQAVPTKIGISKMDAVYSAALDFIKFVVKP